MIESARIDEWLYTLLSGDTTLTNQIGQRIYNLQAPQDAALPFVIFGYMQGIDVQGVGTARVMSSVVYQVKAVDEAESFTTAKGIADRLDALVQGASGSVSDGQILAARREQIIQYVETDVGIQYRHLGGLYRIFAQ